jgi:MADS-box transcription factor
MRLVQERIEDLQGDSDDDDGRLATGRDEFDEASCHGGTTDASPSRRRIDIRFIPDKNKRHISFSKRKAGIFKKVSSSKATMPDWVVLTLH